MLYPTRGRSLRPHRIATAVTGARELLRRIGTARETPNVPLALRKEARAFLRFYPTNSSLYPVLENAYQLKDYPMPKSWPVWPEHEFQ